MLVETDLAVKKWRLLFMALIAANVLTNSGLVSGGKNECSYQYYLRKKYYTRCYNAWDWFKCTKYRSERRIGTRCCEGWKSETTNPLNCNIPHCISGWNRCPNGGTCVSPSYCTCPRGYYSPDCNRCTQIANCAIEECSSAYNQRCVTCDYEYTHQVRAYKPVASNGYPDRVCEQLCSWMSNSKQCYPGKCTAGTPNSCQCAPDFGGSDCMEIRVTPDITYCLASIIDSSGENTEVKCETVTRKTKFTNLRASNLQVDWRTQYKGPSGTGSGGSVYPFPYYIEDYDVGLISAKVEWTLSRGSTIGSGSMNCGEDISRDNPDKGLKTCRDTGLINSSLSSGDVLEFKTKSTNGGRLKIKSYTSGSNYQTRTEYYSEKMLTHTASFTFDYDPPYHCLQTCSSKMLYLGNAFTKQKTISITWHGWKDSVAGIRMFRYEVYKLRPFGEELDYGNDETLFHEEFTSLPSPPPSFTLSEPGMYCVLLIVSDNASDEVLHANHRLARRFLLYDDSSRVEKIDLSGHQMYVNTAAANTSYQWITTLHDKVSIKWNGHFMNKMHKNNKTLNAIASHSIDIDQDYEVRTGLSLSERSMEAIPNINGIVRYDLMYATDHEGGRTLTSPTFTWETLQNFQNEHETRHIARRDGDSVKFWVKAYDILNNTVTDDVLVHVDSSPPHIENVGLVRDGEKLLMVHSNLDLFDLVLEFDTFDHHSGLKQITWVLRDMKDDTFHGDGSIAVVRTNKQDASCTPESCYCIEREEECFMSTYQIIPELSKLNKSTGQHDFDYIFEITVINNAMLKTSTEFQITIDVSPPLAGHVCDAEPGDTDIDYQSSFLVHASWNGFFDRESGIKYYKYAIHRGCLTATDFASGTSSVEIIATFNTYMSERVNQTGTYYTTVVAYNHALEPSHPVCSDGVTIDMTGPVVTSIHVSHAFIKPGLVTDGQTIMYMDEEGFVYELTTQTQDSRSKFISNLSAFEIRQFSPPIEPSQTNCSSYQRAGERHYMGREHMFEVTWEGTDKESTVHDYTIALSSTDAAQGDIMPYKNSHGQQHFITYHPNLVDFQDFYISVKAINKAGLDSVQTIGPFEMRRSGPVFDGDLTMSYHTSREVLVASFGKGAYSEEDINNTYLKAVEYSLGEGSCTGDLISWTAVDNPANSLGCDNTWPPTCVLIDPEIQGFHLHDNTDYCLSLRLHGYNKLVTSVSSWYSHSKMSVSSGMLWEIDTSTDDLVEKDIDYQTSTETLYLRYMQPEVNTDAEFFVGVGTVAGNDDIRPFSAVDITDIIKVDHLSLELQKVYYSTVKIMEGNTSSLVQSDGVLILPENTELESLTVNDGAPCSEVVPREDWPLLHNESAETDVPGCNDDIDYQTYTTELSAHWNYSSVDAHIQYFIVTVEKMQINVTITWDTTLSDYRIGNVHSVHLTGLHLEGGQTYRVVIQACHPVACYLPKATDGVMILPREPIPREITQVQYNETETSISVAWQPFIDPYHGVDFNITSQYAIALFARTENGKELNQITKWHQTKDEVYTFDSNSNIISATYILEDQLEASACLVLAVRGFNKAMLYSTSYKEFIGCSVPDRVDLLIFDAVGDQQKDGSIGDIALIANEIWPNPDAEYTESKTSLAAVWPTFRHGYMKWSVVHGDNVNRLAYKKNNLDHLDYWDFDCALPEVLACGSTYDRFVNVHHLSLDEGTRYHVCVYANATTLQHEKWQEHLPELSVCTNGVTVDTEPPVGGSVWIGSSKEHQSYQTDNLVLDLHWSAFLDVEVNQRTSHHSGVKTYQLAIGSSVGGQDVLDFQDVGVTNFKIVNGLALRNGETYYATIKALDFVGHETSVTSEGITIDTSPPRVDRDQIYVSSNYLTTDNSIQISYTNGVITDPESGIERYIWCIGSKQHWCDTLERTTVSDTYLVITSKTSIFGNGQEYFVTLEAYNGAGLSASTTVATFIFDGSGPTTGFVSEVEKDGRIDKDYQTSSNELYILWGDFNDPESHIIEYRLTVGSCKSCADILEDLYVGLVNEYHIDHLELKPGVKYFSQIKACNSAYLCTSSQSDGITVDGTPPHLGPVLDGLYDEDTDYQPTNTLVQAHLENPHDLQSGISLITWWAGTSPGDMDVFMEETTHSHTVLQHTLSAAAADGTTIYVTVKACNNAGLCTVTSSDGSTVDTTKPSLTSVELSPLTGVLRSNYQVYRNTVALQWISREDISPITTTYISMLPQDDAHLILPTIKLMGDLQSHVISGLDLRDGDSYRARVMVCNAARLCEESFSTIFMVDSSPPTSGAFAVDTEHAVELSRQRDGHMTYNNSASQVKLAWVGFQDPHSDILDYRVRIGIDFYTSDIADYTIYHQSSDAHRDEGFVVTETMDILRNLTPNEEIYISVYATNKAGLQSTVLHGLFITIPSGGDTGILALERRCPALSCVGHCMCAPHGFYGCDITGNSCTDKSGDGTYAAVHIFDVLPSTKTEGLSEKDYIPSVHILQAMWTVDENGVQPKWFDWSVGLVNQVPGSGLLDVNTQPVWYEAGTSRKAVFSVTNSKLIDAMSTHATYVFYVKAWYDSNSYIIYQSDGVQVDSTAPELSDSYSVIEVEDPKSLADVDFTTSHAITIMWRNVFRDSHSPMDHFDVLIYSDQMLSVISKDTVEGDVDELLFTGLSLTQGEHYISVVTGCNKADLCIQAVSDGFVLDITPPHEGSVLDGSTFHDIEYSSDSQELAATWQGFIDDESGIHHYVWCVTIEGLNVSCDDVGLHQTGTMAIPANITNGAAITSSVYAVNGAGLSSSTVSSNGYTLDLTPPTDKHYFRFADNILINGNFSSDTNDWNISATYTNHSDGNMCILSGRIRQTSSTLSGQRYKLQFDVVNGFEATPRQPLGYLKFGPMEHHFISAVDVDDPLHLHHKVYFITSHTSSTTLELGTMTDMMLCFGNIQLQPIKEGFRDREDADHPETSFTSSVHVHVSASSMGTSLTLNWHFEDLETPIVDYMFAVGTVKGGIQLKDFQSTGKHSGGSLTGMRVQHGTVLHVTVVATNAAGLSTMVYADPVIVDLTPPVIELFQINNGKPAFCNVSINMEWKASDPESGIEHCDFYIVNQSDKTSDLTYSSTNSTGTRNITFTGLRNGDKLSCRMKCKSFSSMYSEMTTGQLTYVTEPANTEKADIVILPYSESFHDNTGNVLSSADVVGFRWEGIVDHLGIESCEIVIKDGTSKILPALSLGSMMHNTVMLRNASDIFTETTPLVLSLMCINDAGFPSDPVTEVFLIDSTLPSYTGEPLGVIWKSETEVQINWSSLFTSSTTLVYELHLGTTPGGIDVLSWFETKMTDMKVTQIDSSLIHYLSVSAIGQNGLCVTNTFEVKY